MIQHPVYTADIKAAAELPLPFEKLEGKTVLITGASGLICSFLVDVLMHRNLHMGANVTVYAMGRSEASAKERFGEYFGHPNFKFLSHDINKPLEGDVRYDYMIHGASNTHPRAYSGDPVGTITTNVLGTYNLLEYAKEHGTDRFFLLSTVEIYGDNRGDVELFDESYCGYINCNTMRAGYPESKRVSESLCQAYMAAHGIDVSIGRLCRVYGPTMKTDDSKALAQFIRNALNNEDIVLKSEGKQHFSYLYMADAVTALLTVLLKGETGAVYNISHESSDVRLRDLAGLIAAANGRKVVFDLPDEAERKGFSTAMVARLDSTLLQQLGWQPADTIESGVEKTITVLRG